MTTELELRNDHLAVQLTPDRGADITALTDARTGAQLLYRTPWADSAQPGPWAPESRQSWQALYQGGWQLLCPNAGDASNVAGGTWGFHGEACLLRWTVEESTSDSATLSVRLSQAPLRIRRQVVLDGSVLKVEDTFRNESPDPVSVAIVHHPAFGAPLVTPGARIASGAQKLTVDPTSGPVVEAGATLAWPVSELSTLPPGGPGQATLAYFGDFTEHWVSITSADGDLGVVMAWNGDVLPNAWLWFEGNATPGLPWYRTEYVFAAEPASTIPAGGVEQARANGGNLVEIAPRGSVSTAVCLAVHHDSRPVTGMDLTGRITFERDNR
ncbi:DUF4432 family protein [Saccharopolyspora spinosa]|uniref:Uncharacterized protein DUF4432 n=1 Tax=Saccharopolyspora spinosa TaxID=60894 RepID=A0A2N3Y7H1_SACSN|nr:DUF4432 family protein [Saccharopolyspora spinosa]PKW18850.1 uncharacterized protein DUF4432 [Saccharopolyspora spinosa]